MLLCKGKQLALILAIVSAVTVGGYASARALDVAPSVAQKEKSEKQKAFEEHLAKEEAEFEKRYNEVKKRNDELRKEFDKIK